MPSLFHFIKHVAASGNQKIIKAQIPLEFRVPGAVFYGLDTPSIQSLIYTLLNNHPLSEFQNESSLVDKIHFVRNESDIHNFTSNTSRRIFSTKHLKLTDSEFELLKNSNPALVQEKSKQAFLDLVNNSRNAFTHFFFAFQGFIKDVPHYKTETPLYSYLAELLNASDILKDETLELDNMVLANNSKLEAILKDLKTNQRVTKSGQQIPLLHELVTVDELREEIVAATSSFNLKSSIHPGKVVKTENGVMLDLGELSFQNHIVKQLNNQKQLEESLKPKELTEDELLIQFLNACRKANSLSEVSKTPIPEGLKEHGRVFHGLKHITIYAIMVKLIKLDKQKNSSNTSVAEDYNLDLIYNVIEEHKLKLQKDLVHNLLIRISEGDNFQITDQEFEALKQDSRFFILDTKEEFCQKVKATPSIVMDKLAQVVYLNDAEQTVAASKTPLYRFVVRFISDRKAACADFNSIDEVLQDLKTTQRLTKDGKALPKLKDNFDSYLTFIEVVAKVCEEHTIQSSIAQNALIYKDKELVKDLGELTLQKRIIESLNNFKESELPIDVVSYTSLVNTKKHEKATVNISPADAAKALKKGDEYGAHLI